MLTKSRLTLAVALAAAAIGTSPALAMPVDGAATTDSLQQDMRGEHAAGLSESAPAIAPAIAPDQRTADAQEPFVRPVVVEVGDPVSGGFDWTAGIIGLAGGLALAVLAGVGVAGARRRPVRPTVG